jgi:uncharacterized cupin superfamily protein
MKAVINPAELPLSGRSHSDKFAVQTGEVAEALGLSGLGCMLHVVPPGKRAFPFHRHHISDEMFVILSGNGEYRIGKERLPVKPGDCLGAPAGGEAHQIINNGSEELRYLGFSNNGSTEIVEYPDTGKIAATTGMANGDVKTARFRAIGRLAKADYWDGE